MIAKRHALLGDLKRPIGVRTHQIQALAQAVVIVSKEERILAVPEEGPMRDIVLYDVDRSGIERVQYARVNLIIGMDQTEDGPRAPHASEPESMHRLA